MPDKHLAATEAEAARLCICAEQIAVNLAAEDGYIKAACAAHRREVERSIDARLAPIRALAERWVIEANESCGGCDSCDGSRAVALHAVATELLDALDARERKPQEQSLCGLAFGGYTCELPNGHDGGTPHAAWPRWTYSLEIDANKLRASEEFYESLKGVPSESIIAPTGADAPDLNRAFGPQGGAS